MIVRLAGIVGLLSNAVAAQPPASPPTPDIVVTAPEQEAIRSFVEAVTDPSNFKQIPKWDREVCPLVLGVDPAQAAFMEQRVRQIATTVHLHAGGERKCATTSLIVVTSDADQFAKSLVARYPVTLRHDGADKLARFAMSKRPVRWIALTNPCGFGGCQVGTRLRSAEQAAFDALIVVVDANRIAGFSVAELSDYVGLILLTNPPLGERAPRTSILSMFDRKHPADIVFALTANDRAYLDALYSLEPDMTGSIQRASIASQMRRVANADH